jgi:hypothetical protein
MYFKMPVPGPASRCELLIEAFDYNFNPHIEAAAAVDDLRHKAKLRAAAEGKEGGAAAAAAAEGKACKGSKGGKVDEAGKAGKAGNEGKEGKGGKGRKPRASAAPTPRLRDHAQLVAGHDPLGHAALPLSSLAAGYRKSLWLPLEPPEWARRAGHDIRGPVGALQVGR